MPQLSGHAIVPVDHPTAGNESRSQPGSKRYHDEIPHSPGIAVSDLPESGGIGVVGDTDGNPGKELPTSLQSEKNRRPSSGFGSPDRNFQRLTGRSIRPV